MERFCRIMMFNVVDLKDVCLDGAAKGDSEVLAADCRWWCVLS
jgi:hypothetical protein